jgi:hypothetical protein
LEKIKDIDPYLRILQRASAAGAGQVSVQCALRLQCLKTKWIHTIQPTSLVETVGGAD